MIEIDKNTESELIQLTKSIWRNIKSCPEEKADNALVVQCSHLPKSVSINFKGLDLIWFFSEQNVDLPFLQIVTLSLAGLV